MTSATTTPLGPVELHDLPSVRRPSPAFPKESRRLGPDPSDARAETESVESAPNAPDGAVSAVEAWNNPRSNAYKLAATFWSFIVSGANDAAYGALIPYLEEYYHLSYIVVSLIFLSPFVGYILAAAFNNRLHRTVGQRGIAIICGVSHLAAYIITSQHPPYPVLVVAYLFAGFGNGVSDAAWNAWIGNLAKANELLGFLHAFYGVGGTIAPLIATSMIARGGLPWYTFYYVLLGMSALELATCTAAFWTSTAQVYRDTMLRPGRNGEDEDAGSRGSLRNALLERPHARVAWLCAFFLLAYVGVEVSLGGWIVQFMIHVRKADHFPAGMTSVGFWLGLTVGRAVLGFVTPRLGVKLALALYLPVVMGAELIFWLVPSFYVSAVAVAVQGFFLGPMFPGVIVVTTKLLPKHLHVSTIGFCASFGGSGAAVLPFAVGAIAQAKGVQVLQPIILALVAVLLIIWLSLPRIDKKRD